ncbi:hypothetical protein LOZ53_005620 [Ophidiomyces ophidiicola]|uniref:Uncharacterized protein n=1 Tax=Ophidiomyces ophidiicola TaxID=1387563 RepID=A0ACB8UWD7_9EURO|nr:uncharacterized protein LOZ57_002528 [Ophidiomyces ophidiicola]KAI1915118.1 hypothetical protein LOZ61_001793 [Ophidiomyces ophidiicola]KAI1917841.1 hypothetical protein LOZ64_002966 [Ophidiomyces ophidiicola]KAI1929950.1 hypothetical protein LOZ60_001207 [Ophidiomyces ophidiicola]KAI1949160.1 hypothetical protein LOZ57_002528 [Ophidiomyces ophidiicola]KAI1955238.1 hypothetical protein LOZ62_000362 [Ophidiomyces ophidiicola]
MSTIDPEFPYSLTLSIPFPTHRLASSALQALQVDAELSALVRRTLRLTTPSSSPPPGVETASSSIAHDSIDSLAADADMTARDEALTVLQIDYKATTNRMLRVAVNAFMDSLGVVIEVMERLDVDVLTTKLGK